MSMNPLSDPVKKAMIDEAMREAADIYAQITDAMQAHIKETKASAHPHAMPLGIREAVMLGAIGACIANHVALLQPETRKWAQMAMKEANQLLDAQSLLGGLES